MASASSAAELADQRAPSPLDETRTSQPTQDPGALAWLESPAVAQVRDPRRYRILGEHGRGGLGRVARAHDVELGRDIAIKELIARGPLGEVRFLREALITARLEHPGIVPVHEAGRWPDGTPFYAMKLVAGRPLRALLVQRVTVDERIGLLHHVIAVADAIAYAHGRNIIHRDLKPSNIIVGDFGETIVIDWGLAKELTAAEDPGAGGDRVDASLDDGLTSAGSVLGTPAYMAPEQARGEPVDQRADVFAIGAMLWELCSLERLPTAYAGQRRRILRSAGIDPDLITIIEKAVDPDPARRYSDAGALAADLKAFKAGARIAGRRYSPWALLAHWTRRHRAAAVAIVGATAVALAGAWFYVHGIAEERDRAELATAAAQDANAAKVAALSEKQLAEARSAAAALEQGRAALLHDEPEALARLTAAYRRDPSRSTAFMLARAMQSRLQEEASFASTFGRMWSAAFSPDGTQIVTTDDRAAQIWNSRSHQVVVTLPHGCEVTDAAYSADGKLLVTAAQTMVRVWDPRSGVLLRDLRAKSGGRVSAYFRTAISPDGQFVAVDDLAGATVRVWSAVTGKLLAELHNPEPAEFPSLAFSADGWLATSGGGDVRVFEVGTWAPLLTLPGPARSLAFDTHSHLVIGTATGDVALWSVPGGARLQHLRQVGEAVGTIAFSPDGQLVAAGSRDGVIQIWQVASGVLRSQLDPRHNKIQALEFDATGTQLLAANSDGTVVVADSVLGLPVALLEGPRGVLRTAHFAPNTNRVVAASWDGTATVWNADSPYHRWSSTPIGDDCGIVTTPEPQGRYVATSCLDHPVRIWDTAHDRLLAELPSVTRIASGGFVSAFPAVSAEGDRAAIARGNAVEVYELPGGRLLRSIAHGAPVSAVAFAATGRDVISGAVDGSLLVTPDDGASRPLQTTGGVDMVAVLRDGRAVVADAQRRLRFYSAGGDVLADLEMPVRVTFLRHDGDRMVLLPSYLGTATPPLLVDAERYRVIATLTGHVGRVFSARWVLGGRILTTGGDGTSRLWDGVTGRLLQVYRGGTQYLGDAMLTDEMVIAGDAEGLLRFWDASSGSRLWTMKAHRSAIVGVSIEGDDMVTRGFNGEITRWRLPPAEQVIEACRGQPLCAVASE